MALWLVVLLPFVASLGAAFLPLQARRLAAWLAGLTALACLGLLASLYADLAPAEPLRWTAGWMPQYGLGFSLRLDGYAWVFAVLVAAMGVLVVFYARYYMASEDPVPRFFSFLMAFMGSALSCRGTCFSSWSSGSSRASPPSC